ncbi:MAG: efflux RND transporter periplasmic adaptor subunit [Planctomycetaceae bacterium]
MRPSWNSTWIAIVCLALTGAGQSRSAFAQPAPRAAAPAAKAGAVAAPAGDAPAASADTASTATGQQIIVRREALALIDPRVYRIGFQLEPKQTLELIAPHDGLVVAVHVKIGDKVEPQFEVMRFDSNTSKLQLDRAKTMLKIAQVKLKAAEAQNEPNSIELSQAEVELANVDLELAKLKFEQGIIRAPFAGEILDLHVIPGQFVRAGDRLLTLGDTSQLKVEIPWERTAATVPGGAIDLKVEEQTVEGTIDSVKPLAERFQKLRDLANSVTSVIVVVNNPADGNTTKHFVGQSVYPPLIPRHSVTEIPTQSLHNDKETGRRRVQVLRDFAVRDLTVDVLGSIGPERLFISGAFQEKDELILESSIELVDGTQLRPYVGDSAEGTTSGGSSSKPRVPVTKSPGF